VQSEEKDQVIKELQYHLKESQHVITQSFHDNREMKRKLVEMVSNIQTPQDEIGLKKESVSKVPEGSKRKEIRKSPKNVDLTKLTAPLTRSSSKKISSDYRLAVETHAQAQPVSVEKIHTSPREGEKTIKWIKKKLREAQHLIIHLREENRLLEMKFERHFKEYGPATKNSCAALTNAQSKLRKSALLFRQARNLKGKNVSLRKENRSLKLRMKVDDEARGNLDLLSEVAKI
jgi:hypothetical protein